MSIVQKVKISLMKIKATHKIMNKRGINAQREQGQFEKDYLSHFSN